MATPLTNGNVIEVRIVSFIPEQIALNRLYYEVGNLQGSGADTANAAFDIDVAVAGAYRAVMPVTAEYRGVSVQRVFPLPRTVADVQTGLAGPGLAAGGLQPTQVAALVAKKTGFAGRAFRGRAYAPFPSDSFQAATGKPSGAFVAGQLNAFALALAATIVAGLAPNTVDLTPVLFKTPAGPATSITSVVPRTEWATQRRRGGFGAKNVLPF